MRSIDWRQINWPSIVLNSIYVMVLGIGVAFLGRVFGLAGARDFDPAFTLLIGLITIWVSYRVATRAGHEPLVHGLLVGLLVALTNLALNYLTVGLGVPEIAGFLLQVLGGLLGGRMAQRVLEAPPR